MEKRVQLNVSIPFSAADMRDVQHGVRLYRHSDRQLVQAYLDALAMEMEACALDMSGVRISAIRLVGGTIHSLDEGQLEAILEKVYTVFDVEKGAEIVGIVSPGFYHTLPWRAMRRFGVSALMDIPSFDRAECQRRGLPYRGALSFGEAEDAGIRVFGIRTLSGLAGRTWQEWDAAYEGICARKPRAVELADAGEEEDKELKRMFCEGLLRQGYLPYATNAYALETPRSRAIPEGEYLGVGLSAQCRFDGYETRNTPDIRAYISAQGRFDGLYESIAPYRGDSLTI